MYEHSLNKIVIEPIMQQFLDNVNAQGGEPIHNLPITEARDVLSELQDIPITKSPADIQDVKIPVGPKGETEIRIVRPKDNNSKLPVIMYFHGGGWILGDNSTHDRLIRELANETQAALIFVNFSRSPESQYPTAIEEAYEATNYIANNSKHFNIDSNRFAVAGDSVGGNMATVLTMLIKERGGPKIKYQILFYPVTDANFETESYKEFEEGYWLSREAMKWFWNAYLPDEKERKKPTASPLQASLDQLKDLPPALIITNENDVLRDEGEAYAHKLMEAGVNTSAIRLLGTIHDCLLVNAVADSSIIKDTIDLVTNKLRNVFKTN